MRRSFLVALCALGCLFLAWREMDLAGHASTAYFLEAGGGDATLLLTDKGRRILVDAGDGASILDPLGRLLPFFDRRIDLLVLTHPDANRSGALPALLKRYEIGAALLTQRNHANGKVAEAMSLLRAQSIPVYPAVAGQSLSLDELTLHVLWPPEGAAEKESTVILRIDAPSQRILLSGSIPADLRRKTFAGWGELDADIWRLPSGSRLSEDDPLWDTVSPMLVIAPTEKTVVPANFSRKNLHGSSFIPLILK